jgi:hypothetical protein
MSLLLFFISLVWVMAGIFSRILGFNWKPWDNMFLIPMVFLVLFFYMFSL